MTQLPVFRGAMKGGHTPVEAADSLMSNQTARILDLLSEGEIEGLVGDTDEEKQKSIYYNEVPLLDPSGTPNFTGVSIVANYGTPDQPSMPGFDASNSTVSVSQVLPYNVYKTVSFPNDGSITAMAVTLSVSNFFEVNKDGDTNGSNVTFQIELSMNGGAFTPIYNGEIRGKQTDEYDVDYRFQITDPTGNTAVRIKRTKPDSTSLKINDELTFKLYTKIIEHTLNYPNLALVGHVVDAKQFGNSIPQRQYRVRGIKCRIPHNYDPVTRTYTGPFNGTLTTTKHYTNCGPWLLYELVTNKRFGLGDFFDASLLDIPTLYRTGKFADEMVSDGKGGLEPRWTCNTVINNRGDAFNVLKELVSNFRASLFWMQAKLWVIGDGPRDPVKIVTNANVLDGRFTYSGESNRQRASVVNVSYNDPDLLFRRSIESVEDPNLIREIGYKTKDFGAFGCTSRAQARRLGRAILFSQEFESQMVSYKASYDHMAVDGDGPSGIAPGDLILVSDRSRGNALCGGRITAVGATLTLSSSANGAGAGHIYVEHAETGEIEYVACTYNNQTVTLSALPLQPVALNDQFILIANGSDAETFVVLKVTEEEPNVLGVTAVKYDADRIAAIYDDVHLDTTKYMTVENPNVCKPASNLVLDDSFITGVDVYERVVRASWSKSLDPYINYYEVSYSYNNDDWVKLPLTGANNATIRNAKAGTYTCRVVAVNRAGVYSQPIETSFTVLAVPDTGTLPVGTISSLVLQSGGTTTFSGRDVKVVWAINTPQSTYTNDAGITGSTAVQGLSDAMFRDCVVTVRRADTNAVLRTESVIDTMYVYSLEKNLEDNGGTPRRDLKIGVQYRDKYGRLSVETDAQITVSNPAPAFSAAPVVSAGLDAITVSITPPTDSDFVGVLVYANLTSVGVSTSVGNLRYKGADTLISIPSLGTTQHSLIVVPYDVFGTGTPSSTLTATPNAIVSSLTSLSASIASVSADMADLANDSKLTENEKITKLIPLDAQLEATWALLDAQAATVTGSTAVSTARTNASTARTAWQTYRNALTPAWNNTTLETAIVRATFNGKVNDYSYALDALVDALRQYAATTSTWAGVSGTGRPSDNAGTSGVLTAFGTNTVVAGNTVSKPTGTHGSYQGGAVGTPVYGTVFISARPFNIGGWHTTLALDDDATSFSLAGNKYVLEYQYDAGSGGSYQFYENGTLKSNAGFSKLNVKNVTLVYDGVKVMGYHDGALLFTYSTGITTGQSLYPKVLSYLVGAAHTDILYGPYTDNTLAASASAAASTASADAATANAALADIASDSLLTPGEKPPVIQAYSVITTEQGGIDTQASGFGITTEKTAYDTAVSALTTYLATLTAPVLWSNLTGNTAIAGATFRSKFSDVYTARQTLLNKIAEIAATRATWSNVIGTGRPADGATASVVVVPNDANATVVGNTITKTGGANWTTGSAYAQQPMIGTALVQGKFVAGFYAQIGITTAGHTASGAAWNSTTGFYVYRDQGSAILQIVLGGVQVATSAIDDTQIYSLTYDGVVYRAYKGSTLLYTSAAQSANLTHFAHIRLYDTGAGLANVVATTNTDNAWASVSGVGRPADGATADIILTSIGGTAVTVAGNTLSRNAGGGDYGAVARSEPYSNGIIAQVNIVEANKWTMVALDGDATSTNYDAMNIMAHYNNVAGNLNVYVVGVLAFSTSVAGITGRLAITYDGVRFRVYAGGVLRHTVDTTTGLTLWAKFHAYEAATTYTGLQCLPFTDNNWANTGGSGRPADNAGTSGVLTVLGSYTTIIGNSTYKSGGTHGSYQGGVYGVAQTGSAFISSSIIRVMSGGGWLTTLALDVASGGFDVSTVKYAMQAYANTAGSIDVYLRVNGTAVGGTFYSRSGLTANSRIALLYDGVNVYAMVDGYVLVSTTAAAGQTLWPKVLDYYNNTSADPTSDILYGTYTQNNWSAVGGAGRPENNATVSDNRIRNADMSDTTTDQWWGTLTRTAGVAANNDPAFFARATAGGGSGGYINNGVNAPCVAGERMYCSALLRAQTVASNNFVRFNPFFWKADGSFLNQQIIDVSSTSTGFAIAKTVFEVPVGAATFTLLIASVNNTGTYTDIAMPRVGYTEFAADVTSQAQVTCEMVSPKNVAADYTGVISSVNLDAVLFTPVVVKGGTSIKTANITTYAVSNVFGVTGGTGFVLDNTTGSSTKGNITVASGSTLADTSGGDLVITVDGVAQPKISFRLTKDKAAPPSSGGGGGGGGSTTVGWGSGDMISITGTSYQDIVSAVRTVTVGAGQTITVLIDLAFSLSGTTIGSRTETVKVQYSVAGANSWNDFPSQSGYSGGGAPASSVTSSSATSGHYTGGDYEWIDGNPGYIWVTVEKTGLSAGDYDLKIIGLTSGTTRYMTPDGSIYASVA